MNYVLKAVFFTLTAVLLLSCSKSNNSLLDASGKHPANWIVNHREAFRSLAGAIDDPAIARTSQCTECHGSDLKGGVTKVSCFSQGYAAFSCHFHPAGYANPNFHGAIAKGFGTALGLKICQGCHGTQYASGVLSPVSCFTCHGISAPHAKNWATSTTRRHSSTDSQNAVECAQCHSGGRLLTSLPAPPVQPAGTAPDCFNNTLCHSGLHPDGWIDPAQHGTTAKSQPGSDKGFTRCQVCHGANFTGGTAKVSCFSANRPNGACHVRNGLPVNSPHAPLPWRVAESTLTHTSTVDDDQGLNAGVCARCHLGGANLRTPIITTYATGTPGCFNSTICHGIMGHEDVAGWADPAQHGATAKANLLNCQGCHASIPGGGPGSNPRFNIALSLRLTAGCETCHQPLTAHPPVLQVPAVFGIVNPTLNTPWFKHRLSTNFDACNRCHGATLGGVPEGGVGPRCQNCHVAALPTSTINSPDPCSSCHSNPPSGTTYPNIKRVHVSHEIVNAPTGALCAECHSGLGSGTLDHFLRVKNIRLGTVLPADQTRAQAGAVVFGGVLSSANGATPVFTQANLQCANTYCHGNKLLSNIPTPPSGVILTPSWDTPFPAGTHCDKCHGYPPNTTTHTGITDPAACIHCHSHVNSTGTGFSDPTKHINGSIDAFFPHSFPNPGSVHKTASNGTGCITAGCHEFGTALNSPYPVTAGFPPNCRACHLNVEPSSYPHCSDCHGSFANNVLGDKLAGRPSGGTFPNVEGHHNNFFHPNYTCAVCHPFTDDSPSHGWSNRTKSTAVQVRVDPTAGISSWDPATGNCTASCHVNPNLPALRPW